jgi:hypothetical protein
MCAKCKLRHGIRDGVILSRFFLFIFYSCVFFTALKIKFVLVGG